MAKPVLAKAAAAKKAAAKTPAAKAEAAADAAHGTDTAVEETATEETATEETTEREAPAMEAAPTPTDFDNLVDLARAIDPKFGSESAKEGTQHFLIRLLTALADSTTEQFDTLDLSAQTWYENAVAEGNDKKDITPPTGYASPASAPKQAAEKKAAAKKTATAKAPREPKAPKEKKVREASKTYPIRMLVCKDPSITLEALQAALPTTGKTTLSTLRSDTLAALKAAQECGWSAPA